MDKRLTTLIYILAFVEGGAVMCVELCSAKILSPFFGTSIYVWAAVLGITLTALMSGYYLGGYISSKNQKKEIIFWIMTIAGCMVSLTPIIANAILPSTINFNLLTGTVVSLMCFLFLPLMLFGATSPLIINFLTKDAKESGKSSGTVYAVSTLGGIITTFIVGFYTLPEFGIKATLYGYGLLVILTSLILFFATKTFKKSAVLLIIVALLSFNFKTKHKEIIYQSEGILGEIKVMDRNHFSPEENRYKPYRELLVNNISQTMMSKENPNESYWGYVDALVYNLNSYSNPEGKNALLLGLGGGTIYRQLSNNNYKVDVVEIDQRIEEIAKEYFDIDPNANVIVDDARHYINTSKKKYDVIIYDLYHSETPPIHLMTSEAFNEIKTKLNDKGILVINFYGFITGSKGKAARSIYKSLLAENYQVRLIGTPGEERYRNLLFICSNNELKSKNQIIHNLIYEMDINFDDAVLLTDDKPILEHIYLEAALAWRTDYNEMNAKYFLQQK